MKSIGILWMQYGPYHLARLQALRRWAYPITVQALEISNRSRDYGWERSPVDANLITLIPNATAECSSFGSVFRLVRRELKKSKVEVCLLPSYSPKQCFAALLATKSLGVRAVMMNES